MSTRVIPTTDPARLGALLAVEETPRVSILMPVNHTDPQQDAIRARGLTSRVREHLDARKVDGTVADRITASIHHAFDELHPLPRSVGTVAVYAGPGGAERFLLPGFDDEIVWVGSEFHVLPVIDAADPVHCFILTLTRGGNAMWRADRWMLTPVPLPGAPGALTDITRYRELEKQLQSHQTARGGAAVFHGHDLGENREMEPVRVYLRGVDQAATAATDGDPAPLLLVGPGSLPALYHAVSARGRFAGHSVECHPDGMDEADLFDAARPVVTDLVAARTREIVDRIGSLRAARRSSTLAAEIVVAAATGRVDTLLFDPATDNPTVVNRAAVATLRHRGKVFPAPDLPGGVAATYRW